MNTSSIIRVLLYDWCNQRVECMVRDGNVIRRVWLPMNQVYVRPI